MLQITNTKINNQEINAVSARELHKFLECTERFSAWFERMCQYGFEEQQDFTGVKSFTVVNNGAEKPLDDFIQDTDFVEVHSKVNINNVKMIVATITTLLQDLPICMELMLMIRPQTKQGAKHRNYAESAALKLEIVEVQSLVKSVHILKKYCMKYLTY